MAQPLSIRKFLIVGYGSTLRSDDGLGPLIAERLRRVRLPDGVDTRILSLPQLDVSLVADFQWADVVLLVDARHDDDDAVLKVDRIDCPAEPPQASHSTHAVTIATLLDMTRKWYGGVPQTYLVMPKGYDFSIGETITARACRAAACATQAVVDHVRACLERPPRQCWKAPGRPGPLQQTESIQFTHCRQR